MRFLIYGEDNYRARRSLAAAKAKFLQSRDPSGLNLAVLRADEATPDEVETALFASPFLAERKLVVLENFLTRWPKDRQERLLEAVNRLPESTNALFFESAGATDLKSAPLFQPLATEKYSVEFPALNPASAAKFIREECASVGCAVSNAAVQALVAIAGNDSWRLQGEIAKLASFAAATGAKEINEAAVRESVGSGHEEPVFAFLDHCAAGRGRDAAIALEQLLESGMAELQVTAMLLKHFRLLVCASDLKRAGAGQQEIASKLGVHPFAAGKALQLVGRLDPASLARNYLALVAIDRAAKTGSGKVRAQLAIFAARLGGVCAN